METSKIQGSEIAKFSQPRLANILSRERLFRLLDDKRRESSAVWLSSQAGSGKTTAVADYLNRSGITRLWYQVDEDDDDLASFFHYLSMAAERLAPDHTLPAFTPEYQTRIQTFARNFFRQLYGLSGAPFALVLDNYQEVPETSPFHDVIAIAIKECPYDHGLFIISRYDPPKKMARFVSNKRIGMVGWDDMQLNSEESDALIRYLSGNEVPGEGQLQELHRLSGGWITGLLLLLRDSERPAASQWKNIIDLKSVFGYFKAIIFEQLDDESARLLLQLSWLPNFSLPDIERLASTEYPGQLLDRLVERHYFIVPHVSDSLVYRLHPLFQEFLRRQSREVLGEAGLKSLWLREAEALLGQGAIDDALNLLCLAEAWPVLVKCLIEHAHDYLLQGRNHYLLDKIRQLPTAVADGNNWLRYWQATALLSLDPEQAYRVYCPVYERFCRDEDPAGMVYSWCGLIDAVMNVLTDVRRMDHWIDELDRINRGYGLDKNPLFVNQIAPRISAAMILRRPEHPDLSSWVERLLDLVANDGMDPSLRMVSGFYLITYANWIGDPSLATYVLEIQEAIKSSTQSTVLSQIITYLGKIWYYWSRGQHQLSLAEIEKGVALAEQSGVDIWTFLLLIQGVTSCFSLNDVSRAEGYFEQLVPRLESARQLDLAYYYHERGWQAILQGDVPMARRYQQRAVKIADELGAVFVELETNFGLAQVCFAEGSLDEAYHQLDHVQGLAERLNSHTGRIMCDFIRAYFLFSQGDDRNACDYLGRALQRCGRQGVVGFSWWRHEVMSTLLEHAMRRGIEVKLAKRIIRQFHVIPGDSAHFSDDWNWPVKVYTLGTFGLVVDGQAVEFRGKAQNKPLEMLKALISFGGREVSEERISAVLWEDADGDAAHQSFSTTLHRLRKILGQDALHLGGGLLSLNPRYCWVDAWRLEEVLGGIAGDAASMSEEPQRVEVALQLYRGAYLENEPEAPWLLGYRERLRNAFVHALAAYAKRSGDEPAIDVYQRGLAIDELLEPFYQGLMEIYLAQGRQAEAYATYQRCRAALAAVGLEPSRHTERLMAGISSSA